VLRSSDDVIDIVERSVVRALPCTWAGHAFADPGTPGHEPGTLSCLLARTAPDGDLT